MSATMGTNELTLALRLEGTTGAASVEVERLVAVADMVATLPDPEIDPVFAAKLEQRLLTEGLASAASDTAESYQGLRIVRPEPQIAPEREETLAPNVITLPRRRFVVRKAIAGLIAAALAMAMPVALAANSLPGSPGYFLNKARFALQLEFASAQEKPFKMAHRGHELISFSSRLVAIGAPSDLVNDTLAEAKHWLASATASVIRTGKTGDIAKLRGMIERDGDLIRTMLPTGEGFVIKAIDHIESLSDALARAMGVVLTAPAGVAPAVESIAASIAVPNGNDEAPSKASNDTKAPAKKNNTSNTPAPPIDDPGQIDPARPGGCANIGSAQLGGTLDPLSEHLCAGSSGSKAAG